MEFLKYEKMKIKRRKRLVFI